MIDPNLDPADRSEFFGQPATAAERLAEIESHHGDDRPCSMRNDECFLLNEVKRLQREVQRLRERYGPAPRIEVM